MGKINKEEIRGYRVGNEIVCEECISAEELDAIEEGDILVDSDVDDGDDIYFCDRCKTKL